MVKEKTGESTELRKKAEKKLKVQTEPFVETSVDDTRKLLHELRVHQVELELQNEELRNAQAQIEESRARYSDLYDFAPVGYLTLNDQGLIIEANLTGARQLGIERGRLVDTPLVIYIAVQDRQKFLSFLKSICATQKQQNCVIKVKPKVGDAFFALVDGIFVQGSDNQFCRISISDISDRKEAGEALRISLAESRQREKEISALLEGSRTVLQCHDFADAARAIFDVCKTLIGAGGGYVSLVNEGGTENIALFVNSGDQSCTVDPDLPMPLRGIREVVRRAGKAMMHNDFAQSEFVVLLPEGHSALDNVLFAPMIINGKTVGLLCLANKPGGFTENDVHLASGFTELAAIALVNARAEQKLQHAHATLEQLVDERTAQLVTANRQLKREIQKHKQTHEKLLDSEELYRQTAENIRGFLWMADGALNEILYVNPAYEEIWGRTRDSLYADPKSWLHAAHPEDLDRVLCAAAQKGVKELDVEFRILLPDGSVRWIWSRSFPVRDQSGKVYRVAGIAEDITARKQTEESLRESEQRLRSLSSRLLTAQEDERKRIAHELHDSIGSSLSAVKLGLDSIFKDIAQGIATIDAGSTLISITQYAIDEVRRIMMDLRPSILDDFGLVTTIGWLCRRFQSVHSDIDIENEIAIGEEDVPDSLKIVVFRIMQEALNNIAKYSKADRISLSFVKSDSSIELTIEDNGTGFDLSSVLAGKSHKRGLGLTSMQERTELSGGRISIDSTIGVGTTIRAIW
ncbi:MAG: PAS domain S-box protein, partial [Geobacteraceae bacterium]